MEKSEMMALAMKAVAELKKNPDMLKKFLENPVPVVEGFVGMDLPDDQILKAVDMVKSQIDLSNVDKLFSLGNLKKASNLVDSLGDMFGNSK